MTKQPTHVRWTVFTLGCGVSWFLYFHRYLFSLIKPTLGEEWQLSNLELGVVDTAFTLCYSLFQFPLGLLVDLLGPHLLLTLLMVLWSLAIAGHAVAVNLTMLTVVRGAFATFQSGALAALSQVTRRWFPQSTRTMYQGWMVVFAARLGGASASLIFMTVMLGMMGMDWRTASYLVAIAGLLMALAFAMLFRNSPRHHSGCNESEIDLIEEGSDKVGEKLSFRELLRGMSPRSIANLLSINLQATLSTFADSVYSLWIPKFLFDVHKLEFKEMGIIAALPLIGGALGGACGGWLNDGMIRWTGNRKWARRTVGLTGKMLAGIILLVDVFFYYDNPYVFCSLLFVVKFVGDWSLAAGWGTITDIGGKATASVFAFNNSIAGIGGLLSPILIGYIADAHSWTIVFIVIAAFYVSCALSWLLINCTIPLFGSGKGK